MCLTASVCVQEFEGKSLLFTWIYGVVIDRLYDVFLGVYIMVWIGGHRFTVSFTYVLCGSSSDSIETSYLNSCNTHCVLMKVDHNIDCYNLTTKTCVKF